MRYVIIAQYIGCDMKLGIMGGTLFHVALLDSKAVEELARILSGRKPLRVESVTDPRVKRAWCMGRCPIQHTLQGNSSDITDWVNAGIASPMSSHHCLPMRDALLFIRELDRRAA